MEGQSLYEHFEKIGDLPGRKNSQKQIQENTIFYTIGYGGKEPQYFVDLLRDNGVKIVIDVRIQPYFAFRHEYKMSGLKVLFKEYRIKYVWAVQLGNICYKMTNSLQRFHDYFQMVGDMLLNDLPELIANNKVALMCAEKSAMDCHRKIIADFICDKFTEWGAKHLE